MDKQKKYKKNYGIPFFAMAFLAAAVFEFAVQVEEVGQRLTL